jgi:hypothetical protein
MNGNDSERDFLRRVRGELDAGLEQLDPAVMKRLRESRQSALEQAEPRPFRLFGMPRLVPVGACATLAVAAVAVSLWFSMRPQALPNRVGDEIEVLTMQGNLDMYKDLEFFQWLARTNEAR